MLGTYNSNFHSFEEKVYHTNYIHPDGRPFTGFVLGENIKAMVELGFEFHDTRLVRGDKLVTECVIVHANGEEEEPRVLDTFEDLLKLCAKFATNVTVDYVSLDFTGRPCITILDDYVD